LKERRQTEKVRRYRYRNRNRYRYRYRYRYSSEANCALREGEKLGLEGAKQCR
jgi:hypothetical protein